MLVLEIRVRRWAGWLMAPVLREPRRQIEVDPDPKTVRCVRRGVVGGVARGSR